MKGPWKGNERINNATRINVSMWIDVSSPLSLAGCDGVGFVRTRRDETFHVGLHRHRKR